MLLSIKVECSAHEMPQSNSGQLSRSSDQSWKLRLQREIPSPGDRGVTPFWCDTCFESPDLRQQGLPSCNFNGHSDNEAEHGQATIPGLSVNPGLHSEGLFHCALGFRLLFRHVVYVTSCHFATLLALGRSKCHIGASRAARTFASPEVTSV